MTLGVIGLIAFQSSQSSVLGATQLDRQTSIAAGQRPVAQQVVRRWLWVLCKFSDVADEPKTPAYYAGMGVNTKPGIDSFYQEASYGAIAVPAVDVAGNKWYTLPKPKASYGTVSNNPEQELVASDCADQADPDVNFTSYYGINFVLNSNLANPGVQNTFAMNRDGQNRTYQMTFIGHPNNGMGLSLHEIGHAFGFTHSWYYDANGAPSAPSKWDVMGPSCLQVQADPVYLCISMHPIAIHKYENGFFPAGRVFTASGGEQTVTLERVAIPQTNNPLMARVLIGGSQQRYYSVEARMNAGYDDGGRNALGNAVIIYEQNQAFIDGPGLKVPDSTKPDLGGAGAMWLPGMTFTDAANNISIAILAETATGFTIKITSPAGSGPTPTNTAIPSPTACGNCTATPTPAAKVFVPSSVLNYNGGW